MSQLTKEQLILSNDAAERIILLLKGHGIIKVNLDDIQTHLMYSVARRITHDLLLNVVDPTTKLLDTDNSP